MFGLRGPKQFGVERTDGEGKGNECLVKYMLWKGRIEGGKQLADTLQSLRATSATFAAFETTEPSIAGVDALERSKGE